MSFKNDLKNAQIFIKNVEFGTKTRLTWQQKFDAIKYRMGWSDEKVKKILEAA